MKPLAIGLLTLAFLLLVAPAAGAQQRGGQRHHAGRGQVAEKLGLTRAQRDQVQAIARQHRDALRNRQAEVREARRALRTVMQASPQDAEALRAAAGRLESARTELHVARGARRAEVQSTLTPEQRTRAGELKAERKAERKAATRAERKSERADRKAGRQADRQSDRKPDRRAGRGPRGGRRV